MKLKQTASRAAAAFLLDREGSQQIEIPNADGKRYFSIFLSCGFLSHPMQFLGHVDELAAVRNDPQCLRELLPGPGHAVLGLEVAVEKG